MSSNKGLDAWEVLKTPSARLTMSWGEVLADIINNDMEINSLGELVVKKEVLEAMREQEAIDLSQ